MTTLNYLQKLTLPFLAPVRGDCDQNTSDTVPYHRKMTVRTTPAVGRYAWLTLTRNAYDLN
jgi:hypothetical protein